MYARHKIDRIGEDIACAFLEENNLKIIERNYRCKIGEIDIIALDKNEIVFVEVKTRSQNEYGLPAEAVNKAKKAHIYHVAEYYMMVNKIENRFCRIDIVEIYMYKNVYKINYIKNAIYKRPFRNS